MNNHALALQLWPEAALQFAAQVSKTEEMNAWSPAALVEDELIYSITGRRYELRLAPRVIGITNDGLLSVQTSLRCTSRLAEALARELHLHECWNQIPYYRIGTFTLFVEWFAGNAAATPQFRPTRWHRPPVAEDVRDWLSLLVPLHPIIRAVQTDAPLSPIFRSISFAEARIPGSKPQWGSQFDRLVSALDMNSPEEVVCLLDAELRSRQDTLQDKTGNDPVECELGRLRAWLCQPGAAPQEAYPL